MQQRVVIVGAGPGGVAAAVQCARLGVRPLLVDRRGEAGGLIANAHRVENYPGLERPLSGPELAARLAAHLSRFGLEVTAADVTGVAPEAGGFLVRSTDGRLRTRCVVLAVGTEPVQLGIPGEAALAGRLLFYEVRDLMLLKPRRVAVIGGGEAAFDYALSLAEAGARVTICVRGGCPGVRGVLAERVAANRAISVRAGASPLAVEERGDSAALLLDCPAGEEELVADAVLAAVGRQSRAPRLLPEGAFTPGGAVETALPGLFVVGDARLGGLGQVGMAVGDGLYAAARLLDGD